MRERVWNGSHACPKHPINVCIFLFCFFVLFFRLHSSETHRERQRHRQREKQAPCREPDVGFDPRSPGSQPELKADPQPRSHPGVPFCLFVCLFCFLRFYLFFNERHKERGREIGRGRSRLPVGSLMWDSIPESRDHDLYWRQMLNH